MSTVLDDLHPGESAAEYVARKLAERSRPTSWRIVWSCGEKTGTSFVKALSPHDAAETLELEFATAKTPRHVVITLVVPDDRDPLHL